MNAKKCSEHKTIPRISVGTAQIIREVALTTGIFLHNLTYYLILFFE